MTTIFVPLTAPGVATTGTTGGQQGTSGASGLLPDQVGIPTLGTSVALPLGGRAFVQNGMVLAAIDLSGAQQAFLGQYPAVQQAVVLVGGLLARSDAYSLQGRQAAGRLCFACARALAGLCSPLFATLAPDVAALAAQTITLCRRGSVTQRGQAYTATGQDSPAWTSVASSALVAVEGYDLAYPAPNSVAPNWAALLSVICAGVTLPPIVPAGSIPAPTR